MNSKEILDILQYVAMCEQVDYLHNTDIFEEIKIGLTGLISVYDNIVKPAGEDFLETATVDDLVYVQNAISFLKHSLRFNCNDTSLKVSTEDELIKYIIDHEINYNFDITNIAKDISSIFVDYKNSRSNGVTGKLLYNNFVEQDIDLNITVAVQIVEQIIKCVDLYIDVRQSLIGDVGLKEGQNGDDKETIKDTETEQ